MSPWTSDSTSWSQGNYKIIIAFYYSEPTYFYSKMEKYKIGRS